MAFRDPTPGKIAGLDRAFGRRVVGFVNLVRSAGVPLVVISGYRTLAQNRHVGGAPRSRHLYGRAVDVQVLGFTRDQIPLSWWQALGRVGESFGLRAGVFFRRPDPNHFDDGGVV